MNNNTEHASDCHYGETFMVGGIRCGRGCICGVVPPTGNTAVGRQFKEGDEDGN